MAETIFTRRADASQAALTDNSGGTPANTIAAGVALQTIIIEHNLADLANAQEFQFDPGFAGSLMAINARVIKGASTAAKAATVTGRVNAGALGGGGVVSLTTANCTNVGAQVAGSAITGAKAFTAAQTVGYAISGVTAFAEGIVAIELQIRNDDTAAFVAAMADKWNELQTWAVDRGFWKGAA